MNNAEVIEKHEKNPSPWYRILKNSPQRIEQEKKKLPKISKELRLPRKSIYNFKLSKEGIKNSDAKDDVWNAQKRRCVPHSIEYLAKQTKFTKDELRFLYRGFKEICPSGIIEEGTFKEVYAKFFPPGSSSQYAHYIFSSFDHQQLGIITFEEMVMKLSSLMKGTLEDKVYWVFGLYDINHDGHVTKEELFIIMAAIYCLTGNRSNQTIDWSFPEHVERVFRKIDLDDDGVISLDEFQAYCMKDEKIVQFMTSFNSLW